ncbi:MAG: hypothetical protein HQ454_02505 [Acidimicrobiaceae bacterium]|nr:hypothetical protein [Ilumatobacteraceae bacterium]NQW68154.1 hypothetical protein [Acidimicrobiaceae bacterium]
MTDWDPRNPDAATVRYDLSDWSLEERVELVAMLAEADIRHDWDGTELLVPTESESVVDVMLDDVEDDDGAPTSLVGELEEFELDGWTTADRMEFAAVLVERGIGHRWEDDLLLVGVDDADVVEGLLDEFDS